MLREPALTDPTPTEFTRAALESLHVEGHTERWAADHPIRAMSALGLKLHPNTDDPTLHNVSPGGAWELMHSHLGYDITDLRAMMLNGIDGSWADDDQKAEWRAAWPGAFDALAASVAWPGPATFA